MYVFLFPGAASLWQRVHKIVSRSLLLQNLQETLRTGPDPPSGANVADLTNPVIITIVPVLYHLPHAECSERVMYIRSLTLHSRH